MEEHRGERGQDSGRSMERLSLSCWSFWSLLEIHIDIGGVVGQGPWLLMKHRTHTTGFHCQGHDKSGQQQMHKSGERNPVIIQMGDGPKT